MASTTISELDGQTVRAWVNGTLILIGTPVRVTPYMEGLVRVRSTTPFGAGCVLPSDTEAHQEPSGAWTVVA